MNSLQLLNKLYYVPLSLYVLICMSRYVRFYDS